MAIDPLRSDRPARAVIAIVGAGFSGAMVAVHLLRMARAAGAGSAGAATMGISLFEPSGAPGRGKAFSTQSPIHLLNVRAGGMSAFPDDPDHFVRWARSEHAVVDGTSFLPRALYGRYLSGLFEAERAQSPDRIELVPDEVLGAEAGDSGFRLRLRSGEVRACTHLVVATGHALPAAPVPLDPAVRNGSRYRDDPWCETALEGLGRDSELLLLGSGLTAVDVLLEARRRGLRAPIHILSRRGLMPLAHATSPASAQGPAVDVGSGNVRSMLRRLRSAAREAGARGEDWRPIVDGLRRDTRELWRSLSTAEQRRFLRHARAYWEVHRHRIAPDIAARVREEIRSGPTEIHAGRVVALEPMPEGLGVTILPRGHSDARRLVVDGLVNCTGPNTGIEMCGSELTQALLRSGLCAADPLGIGLICDPDGAIVDGRGAVSGRMFTLGPLRKGELWESTAVPEIRVQAERVAARIVTSLPSR